ncbi:MAG: NAD-dependent epimerase/dehydratase family protein [Lachnospiraceae bacterium]|nr:NAD-dependent epimerase/dehydratase family protein [Lachnospiraceae bacterium]
MIENTVYRDSLVRVISDIAIQDGKVLVTGASGLIGSCLVDLLLLSNEYGRNINVYALGRNAEKLKKRFAYFENSSHFHVIEQDIRKPIDNSISFDYIFHGASNADPRNYALYPVETMLINMEGATNVLEYCKAHTGTKVLMMSTFEVYGNADKDVYVETDSGIVDVNKLRSCYPESKRSVEVLTRCYVDEYNVKAVIGRLSSIYGPTMAQDDSKAHAQFIRNGLVGENIVLKSKGEQRRTYCYVVDAVMGLIYVMAKGAIGDVYNIANENAIVSIAEVAQTVADIADTKVIMQLPDEIEKKGYSAPQNCILDNMKLKQLGWEGLYDIKRGIQETLSILNSINQKSL